jgi:hypothetical protein
MFNPSFDEPLVAELLASEPTATRQDAIDFINYMDAVSGVDAVYEALAGIAASYEAEQADWDDLGDWEF